MKTTVDFLLQHNEEIRNYKVYNGRAAAVCGSVSSDLVNCECFDDFSGFSLKGIGDSKIPVKDKRRDFVDKLCQYRNRTSFVTDKDLYENAYVSRETFTKIMNMGCEKDQTKRYIPSKETVLSLSLVLGLNKVETIDLLNIVGYTLSEGDIFDQVIAYCIDNRINDIEGIDEYCCKEYGRNYLLPRKRGYKSNEFPANA